MGPTSRNTPRPIFVHEGRGSRAGPYAAGGWPVETASRPRFAPDAAHGDWLVCGISSQLHQEVVGFDHVLAVGDPNFALSGLKVASVIRLGFLATLPSPDFAGRLGTIPPNLSSLLRHRLADHLDK